MTDAEIPTTILRQIRDEIIATRTELKAEIAATRTELKAEIVITNERVSLVEHAVRDLAQQLVMLTRYVKNTNDDLKKRVSRLEKKSG